MLFNSIDDLILIVGLIPEWNIPLLGLYDYPLTALE